MVGGDLTAAGAARRVAVAVTGGLRGPGPGRAAQRRPPGDALFVTGPLGASAAGLRRLPLRERPGLGRCGAGGRLPAARWRAWSRAAAARAAGATAMMDISDGLGLDLHRLADASGVGFVLDDVPVADGATLEEALGGGEDYELLIAARRPPGG